MTFLWRSLLSKLIFTQFTHSTLAIKRNRFELVTRGFELVTRGFEFVTRGSELVTPGFELVTRGFELALLNCNSCF